MAKACCASTRSVFSCTYQKFPIPLGGRTSIPLTREVRSVIILYPRLWPSPASDQHPTGTPRITFTCCIAGRGATRQSVGPRGLQAPINYHCSGKVMDTLTTHVAIRSVLISSDYITSSLAALIDRLHMVIDSKGHCPRSLAPWHHDNPCVIYISPLAYCKSTFGWYSASRAKKLVQLM